jgi:hypothetical protein
MKYRKYALRVALVLFFLSFIFLQRKTTSQFNWLPQTVEENEYEEEEDSEEWEEAKFTKERLLHEFNMLKNPITGTIPAHIHELELQVARSIPERNSIFDLSFSRVMSKEQTDIANTYISIGPNNISGRSRTLAFDTRNNQVMLTGGVTGGIFRSTNGGASWTFVSPEDDIRSVTSIAQDQVNKDVWYCGTGEVYNAASVQEISVPGTVGHGVFKSTNNGVSWTKLASTADTDPYTFNGMFDLVHRIAVHPTTGHVYAAVHNRIMKSSNGGQTWQLVLGGTTGNNALQGITEILINPTGKVYAAFSGQNTDINMVGVWESSTGDVNTWTRIAGANTGQTGSVAGWLPYGQWGRVVLALSPAKKLYVLYKNNQNAAGSNPLPEADLFRTDVSSGNPATYVWENLNAYVPNEPIGRIEGINPYTTQFNGFNMSINVKPDEENILFIGGTVLDRVNLNETDPARKFRRVGGYGLGFFPFSSDAGYPNHHPDIHGIYFNSNSSLEMYTASDGGIHKTNNNMADTVRWQPLNTGLQTIQFQFISMIPDVNYDWVVGGTQDNGSVMNRNATKSQEYQQAGPGDGASSAVSGFYKVGNNWRQYWYISLVNGTILRTTYNWFYNQAENRLDSISQGSSQNISPSGQSGNGAWLTLFLLDPDSSENLYYANDDQLFRTSNAASVTATNWIEYTGVRATIPDSAGITSLAISRKINTTGRYLFMGTDAGRIYRLANPSAVSSATSPTDITPPTMTPGSYVAGISVNPRNADTVIAVVSNYDAPNQTPVPNIFWTGNATAAIPTWRVISGALEPVSSQSCAIMVKPTGVEYYVGTSIGLYSTASINGNSTAWVKEGSGMMKHAIIRSLYNRDADNKLVIGTHGNGAFMGAVNLSTGVTDIPIDHNFIKLIYPTLSRGEVYFKTGTVPSVIDINCRVMAMNGQVVYQTNLPYQDGRLRLQHLSAGNYIIVFTSRNNKYRYVTRFNKY